MERTYLRRHGILGAMFVSGLMWVAIGYAAAALLPPQLAPWTGHPEHDLQIRA